MKSKTLLLLFAVLLVTILANAQKAPENFDGKAPKTEKAYIPVFLEDLSSVYPQNVDYWTGTTDGVSKTQVSLVEGSGTKDGWMCFDVSSIPAGATISSVIFHGYVNATYYPYWSITPMQVNPVAGSAADIYNAIQVGQYQNLAYLFSNETSSYTAGWKSYLLAGNVLSDLEEALVNGWFAVGISSRDNDPAYFITYDGWNETNKPYLEIEFTAPVAHDVSTISIDIPGITWFGSSLTPKATIKSHSSATETFDVQMIINDGSFNVYTTTKTVINLAPGTSIQVNFDPVSLGMGSYTATACTQLGTDPNAANNCLNGNFSVQDEIISYGYIVNDPWGIFQQGPATFSLLEPDSITSIAPTTSTNYICAGTMKDSVWYGIEYYDAFVGGGGLWIIDKTTGAMILVGSTGTGFPLNGMAYDPVSGNIYAVSSTALYTINTTTGAATLVGNTGLTFAINLACSPSGQLYTVDVTTDNLYSVDKTTGAATQIGPIGFDANNAQDMEYDQDQNICYMAAFNVTAGNRGELRSINVSTGTTTLLGIFTNAVGICGFAIPYNRIVPVELTSFNASVNIDGVELSWSTATELNNSGFQIERSSGNSFEDIGFVGGLGTTTENQSYSYLDNTVESGTYTYRLKQIDFDGTFEYSNTVEVSFMNPAAYSLEQNFPNPFNPSTKIKYVIPEESFVTIKVIDVLGREVMTLVNEIKQAGNYEIEFKGEKLSSGMYLYRMESGNFISTQKMLLLK